MATYTLITASTAEPISVAAVRTLLKFEDDSNDAAIALNLPAAIARVQDITNERLAPGEVWELTLDAFPAAIELARGPVISVEWIKYYAPDGQLTTLAAETYDLDIVSKPARIIPADGNSWPAIKRQQNAVVVRFTAGWPMTGGGTPVTTMPAELLLAVHGLVQHRIENGALASDPAGLSNMLEPRRAQWFFS